MKLSTSLDEAETARLYEAARATLLDWIARLRAQAGDGFPDKVRAFQEGRPCTGATGSRVRTAARPCSASSTRRTRPTTAPAARRAGRRLADRALSRLLKEDWPRSIDEVE